MVKGRFSAMLSAARSQGRRNGPLKVVVDCWIPCCLVSSQGPVCGCRLVW